MAGLLDFLQTPESRMGIGLLAAAGPRADGAGFGQRLNEAMGMQDAYGQNQMRQKFMQAQMDEQQRKTQEAMQQQQAQAALQAAIPSLYSQGEGGRPGAFDVQRALQLGLTPDQISKYASVPDAGRQEVARTIETTDAQGRPVTLQFDKFGGTVGQGLSKFLAPLMVNQGGKINAVDPATLQSRGIFDIGMSPSERDASARGWASQALARERMNFDMAGGAEAGKPQYKDGNWVMPPRGLQPGQAVPALPATGVKDANEALALIDQAKKLIPNATGSYLGSAMDTAARAFGKSTSGDIATGQLQALEGALVAKMPKMSGPQSDKDVMLYRQMAGVIGDPTIPTERKLAALATVEEIQRRYAGQQAPKAPAAGSMGSGSFNSAPPDIANLLTKYGGR